MVALWDISAAGGTLAGQEEEELLSLSLLSKSVHRVVWHLQYL